MQAQIEEKFKECCLILKKGNFLQANEILKEVLVEALDDERIKFAVNCFSFWLNIIQQVENTENPYNRGQILFNEWEEFSVYIKKQRYKPDDLIIYSFKCGIFSIALNNFLELLNVQDFEQKAAITRKIGLCYKKLGEYENARNFLSESNRLHPGNSTVLAELADCFALCGEDRNAKLLFREAFFINAKKIDLRLLDSELIQCLVRKIEEHGFTGDELLEWIPVYGNIFGVFTIKRQLKTQEISKLQQEIYATENELKDPSCNSKLLTPRLCNLYFWLIDHYSLNHEDAPRINEILMRIKILDPFIYQLYNK